MLKVLNVCHMAGVNVGYHVLLLLFMKCSGFMSAVSGRIIKATEQAFP